MTDISKRKVKGDAPGQMYEATRFPVHKWKPGFQQVVQGQTDSEQEDTWTQNRFEPGVTFSLHLVVTQFPRQTIME